jgi:hypothetical protein
LRASLGQFLAQESAKFRAANNLWSEVCKVFRESHGLDNINSEPTPEQAVVCLTFNQLKDLVQTLSDKLFLDEPRTKRFGEPPSKRWPIYLTQDLGAATKAEDTLFPEVQPDWLKEVPGKDKAGPEKTPAIPGLDGAPLKDFPNDFLPNGAIDAAPLTLPNDTLSIAQDRDGHFFVASDSGFHQVVRNEVEGKFLLYAHHRGHRDLNLPKAMFPVFSTVASYEKYCRELRQKLVRNLEARSRNHQLAELMARQTFEAHGLPAI